MRNKKGITIIVVLALVLLDVFCISLNVQKTSKSNNQKDTVEDVKRNNSKLEEIIEEPEEKEEVSIEEKVEEEKEKEKEETPKKNTTNTTRDRETPRPSTPSYRCPEGYQLNGTTCVSSVSANYVCPAGLAEAAGGCINLSAPSGTVGDGESCPDGSTMIDQVSLGEPTVHQCFAVQSKIYTCNDGYSLDGSNCVRTMDATRN